MRNQTHSRLIKVLARRSWLLVVTSLLLFRPTFASVPNDDLAPDDPNNVLTLLDDPVVVPESPEPDALPDFAPPAVDDTIVLLAAPQ
jgi:hypothetical protein